MKLDQDKVKGSQRASTLRIFWGRLKEHPLARVGPGLITGVADDDPSGIATYSQAGAQYGLNMLWTMPLAYPLMAAIQSMCARIGRVTGKGLAANMKSSFPQIDFSPACARSDFRSGLYPLAAVLRVVAER